MRRAKATVTRLAKQATTSLAALETESTVDVADTETGAKHSISQALRLLEHVKSSLSATRLRAMLSLAESELPVLPGDLGADLWLLNCANGTLGG
jgi:phage/plasmid-associated DNA primase